MSSEVLWTFQDSAWLSWQGHSCPEKAEGVRRSTGLSLSKAQICLSSPVAGGMAWQAAKPVPLLELPTEKEGVSWQPEHPHSTKWIRACKWADVFSGSWGDGGDSRLSLS